MRNEFEVDVAETADGSAGQNKIVALTASGPCILDLQMRDCVLSDGCDAAPVTGTGAGTCHLSGMATMTGPFVVDVPYVSCLSDCGITFYVTDHFNFVLPSASMNDAGTSQ